MIFRWFSYTQNAKWYFAISFNKSCLIMNMTFFIIISFYPEPPSARRVMSSAIASVRPSICLSIRPSVHPEWRFLYNTFRIIAISLKFGGAMHSTMEGIAIWNGYGNFCWFHRTLKLSMAGFFEQVWGKTLLLLLFKDFSYWPEIWWDNAQ